MQDGDVVIPTSVTFGPAKGAADGVRLYPDTPDTVALQLRGVRGRTQHLFAHARLTKAQAQELAQELAHLLAEHVW